MKIRASMMTMTAVSLVVLLALAGPAQAGVIRDPVASTGNSMGEFDPVFDIGNLFDQSGMSSGWTSGDTLFDDVLTVGPSSPVNVAGNASGKTWASSGSPGFPGYLDFDLGGLYTITRLAYWGGGGLGGRLPKSFNEAGDASSRKLQALFTP